MADNVGVLGSASATTIGTTTVYTCPVGKAARVKIQAIMQAGTSSDIGILVHSMEIARTGALTSANYWFTNTGAGLATVNAAKPTGATAALTCQPAPPIFWLSAGQTIQYTVAVANLLAAAMDVVGVEYDLTA